jgi:hypothetical protein
MGKTRRTKKFAEKKRLLNPKDSRIKKTLEKKKDKEQKVAKTSADKVNQGLEIKEL